MHSSSQLGGSNRRFTFFCANLPQNSFEVARFEGEEALSELYRFELLLVSRNSDIDEPGLIGLGAQFSLNDGIEGGQDTVYRGLIQEFSYEYQAGDLTFYRATLVPKLWKLETYMLSEIYLDQSRPEIFNTVLENAGLTRADFDVRLLNNASDAPTLDYICQYRETYLNFISRWAERFGVYWWYEESDGNEKVLFSDTRTAQKDEAIRLSYQAPGEAGAGVLQTRRFQSLRRVAQNLPKQLVIRDYSAARASQELKGTAQVNPESGIGEVHLFGRKIKNNIEIELRAKLQAESLLCRADRYFGGSTATGLRCGHFIETADHPRQRLNRRYQLIAIKHRGSQAGLLLDGLRVPAEQGGSDFYVAEFTAIPDNVQYRPETKHPWPNIVGTINAFIDAEGSGQYAELNQYGEYRVQLPFDITQKRANRGSAWIRMATPYAGNGHGMHFPLHKGTEVLLSFINGDPDQPIIIGAVHNSVTPNLVTDENQTQSIIQTAGGNSVEFEDLDGKQGIHLCSPVANTKIHIGAPPPKPIGVGADIASHDANWFNGEGYGASGEGNVASGEVNGIMLETDGVLIELLGVHYCKASASTEVITGIKNETVLGLCLEAFEGDKTERVAGNDSKRVIGKKNESVSGFFTEDFYGGRKSTTVGTVEEEIIAVSVKEIINCCNVNKTLNGNVTEIVTGEVKETVYGVRTEVVNGTKSETVSGLLTEKCGSKMETVGDKIVDLESVIVKIEEEIKSINNEIIETNNHIGTTENEIKDITNSIKTMTTCIKSSQLCTIVGTLICTPG